jgi:eukaryotic-like serine/threonine-protein kinase
VLVVALLLVGLLAGSAWWFGVGRYSPTPRLLGMTQAEAERKLEKAGLGLELAPGAFSETVPIGAVVRTEPEPGSRVLDGGSVSVVLSLGKERYRVPKLRGKTEDAASEALATTNLEVGTITESYDVRVPAGDVISSNPAAGASLKRGDTVNLVISQGKRPIKVKDWTGKNGEQAIAWFTDRDLAPNSSTEFSTSVPEGRVISQQPTTGQLYAGDAVSLVISQGPELVEIPRGIRASGVDAAVQRLEALGLKVETRESDDYLGLGYVLTVEPGVGSQVPVGSTVILYLV